MKSTKQLSRLRNVIANVQVHLSVAAHTKVDHGWRSINYVPDFNRFYYILEGEGQLTIDGITYRPKPGQLFVMPAGVRQSYSVVNENTFSKYWCHFTAQIGDMDLFKLLKLPHFIDVSNHDHLIQLFQRLIHYQESKDFTAIIMQRSVLLEIVSVFLEGSLQGQYEHQLHYDANHRMHKIQTVLKYIDQHLDQNITVQEMAEVVHFHPNYFIRYFNEMMGVTPIQYVHQMKMEKAKYMLTATDDSVSEISRALGMELCFFSRVFKKHTGLPPSGYRKMF